MYIEDIAGPHRDMNFISSVLMVHVSLTSECSGQMRDTISMRR